MEQQRRILLFVTLSMLILLGWTNVIVPMFFPNLAAPQAANGPEDLVDVDALALDAPADALAPANVLAADRPLPPDAVKLTAKHPRKEIKLGSIDPASGFFLEVNLTTQGAAVETIRFNDPRYTISGSRDIPLKMVGNDPTQETRTFETRRISENVAVSREPRIIDWEVVPGSQTEESVAFRHVTSDGLLELTKTYTLGRAPLDVLQRPHLRDTHLEPYGLTVAVAARNLSNQPQEWAHQLQGPVGTPLEDPRLATKWRDVRLGFLRPDGQGVDESQLTAAAIIDQVNDRQVEVWKRPIRYLGVDVQYFAALVVPLGDQLKSPTIAQASPELISLAPERNHSDISVSFDSIESVLPPGGSRVEEFSLYSLPKRQELLTQIDANAVTDFGWLGWICKAMLFVLVGLNDLGLNYGLAIICLTIIVRGLLFPFSRKQALNVEKMKELQPKIKELQQKYAKDKEGLARAQMELFSKNNYNPFSGCLTLVLQMPIFFGLYRALYTSVDLRNARFLWIENLAAPDRLFPLGFQVPFFGWEDFNLLPLLTIALFMGQQKLMMPPPADEEQAMQYRMMNMMMFVMGFMFYTVAAGLCIYFIASSLWGMAERWLLVKFKPKLAAATPSGDVVLESSATTNGAATKPAAAPNAKPSYLADLWQKMQEAADKQQSLRNDPSANRPKSKKDRGRKGR